MPHGSAAIKDESGSFEIGADVDPRNELQKILKNGGGLKLGYRLMMDGLLDHIRIMYIAEKSCWDYYTAELKFVKTPADNLRRSYGLCNGGWTRARHMR